MGQIFSANGDPSDQRNNQTKEVDLKDKGINKDVNVNVFLKSVENCNVLHSKHVKMEKLDVLPSKKCNVVHSKDVKNEKCDVVPSKDVGYEKIQQLDRKDEEKHDLFSRVPSQLQQVDQKEEEKPAFFQGTGKYIPRFQRNVEKAQEIEYGKVEKQPAFLQATEKHINKLQLPTMKQNPELGPRNDDANAIDKVDSSTNEQMMVKDEHLVNGVSVGGSLKKEIFWLNHYNNDQRILLVGEGDFSFSASLAVAFGSSGANIIAATSGFLRRNHRNAIANIEKLTCSGATIMHRLDATKMALHPYLRLIKFDRIIYNFPYFGFTKESPKSKIQKQKKLVRGFLSNAKEMIKEDGEIHMSHKTNGSHLDWDVNELALLEGLCLVREVNFDPADYLGDKNLDCNPSKTYMWRIVSTGFLR